MEQDVRKRSGEADERLFSKVRTVQYVIFGEE